MKVHCLVWGGGEVRGGEEHKKNNPNISIVVDKVKRIDHCESRVGGKQL